MNQKISTKRIAMAGLLAALTAVGSAIRITVPVDLVGTSSIHLGNIFCALSGVLLGPGLGGLAAGLGSAIYDMTNPLYIGEAWLTFLMKGFYGLAAGSVIRLSKKEPAYANSALAALAGALGYAVLYLLKSYHKAIWIQGVAAGAAWIVVLDKLPATIFNGAVAVIFAPVLAITIHKALKQNHLTLY